MKMPRRYAKRQAVGAEAKAAARPAAAGATFSRHTSSAFIGFSMEKIGIHVTDWGGSEWHTVSHTNTRTHISKKHVYMTLLNIIRIANIFRRNNMPARRCEDQMRARRKSIMKRKRNNENEMPAVSVFRENTELYKLKRPHQFAILLGECHVPIEFSVWFPFHIPPLLLFLPLHPLLGHHFIIWLLRATRRFFSLSASVCACCVCVSLPSRLPIMNIFQFWINVYFLATVRKTHSDA